MNGATAFPAFVRRSEENAASIVPSEKKAVGPGPARVSVQFDELVPVKPQFVGNVPRFNQADVNLILHAAYAASEASYGAVFRLVLSGLQESACLVVLKNRSPFAAK